MKPLVGFDQEVWPSTPSMNATSLPAEGRLLWVIVDSLNQLVSRAIQLRMVVGAL